MAELGDLAQSSPTTRSWLKTLQAALSDFEYDQKQFWASFRSRSPRAVVAYLNPSKNKIRLFLPLEPHLHEDLRAAPSSKSWKKRFPSTYDIQDARQLPVAMEFIRWAAARTTAANTNPVDLPVFEAPTPKPMPGEVDIDVQLAIVKQRRGQDRLRVWALLNYGEMCALCDVSDRNLLVASHIVRWADSLEGRGVLSNVICLCCFHDALFERGMWSLADDLTVLRRVSTSGGIINALLPTGITFRSPKHEAPSPRYLIQHRARFGFKSP